MTGHELSDADLLHQFESGTLPADCFPHREHVRTAWLFIRRDGLPTALTTFSSALQRFATAHGAPGLFHVTITWAFLFLIHERQETSRAPDWETFARAHPDLISWKPSILERYYAPETLWSERARRGFVLPDRAASPGVGAALSSTPATAG